jgi:hypothetical protein
MLLTAGSLGIVGIYFLLFPPALPWMTRWMVNGDAQPSVEFKLYSRVFGGVLVAVAIVIALTYVSNQSNDNTASSISDAWDVTVSDGSPLRVDANPEVARVADMAAALATVEGQEESLQIQRSAVVGTDPIGDLDEDFANGDLLVSVRIGFCDLQHVVVQETNETVTVAVTAVRGNIASGTPCSGEVNTGMSSFNLLVLRVPLENKLGDRELVVTGPAIAPEE